MKNYEPSVGMVPPRAGRYDGEVRRARHRRLEPWIDPATGERAPLSPKEWATQAAYAPVQDLTRTFARDDPVLALIEDVRAGRKSADQVATTFVRRVGRARNVVRYVIGEAADSPLPNPELRVLALAATAVWRSAPLTDGDPKEWTHARRHREAAAMLARRGTGRCLYCGTSLASDSWQRLYCGAHQPRGPHAQSVERADREVILGLLSACADALGIDAAEPDRDVHTRRPAAGRPE